MECQTCGYALWNLKARACPECGNAFAPSDFAFRPGTVRFICPHCEQDYYGTDDRGHLVPRAFDCVSCHTPVTMDEMVLLPAEGVTESKTTLYDHPWHDRKKIGFWTAWWRTTKLSMIKPGDLIAAREDDDSLGAAWGFCLTTLTIVLVIGAVIGVAFTLLMSAVAPGTYPPGMTGVMLLIQLLSFGFAIVVTVVFIAIWALVTHAALKITGGTAGTIRTTFHALLYSGGTYALAIIPCLNNISPIWWLVSAILMVKRGHEVSGVRASFAVLLAPITSVLVMIAAYGLFIAWLLTTIGAAPTVTGVVSSHPEMMAFAAAAEERAFQRGAGWDASDHALLLLAEDWVNAYDYIAMETPTTLDEIPLAEGMTLQDFTVGTGNSASRVATLITPLPADVVAHRVGDFVFTWHGIDAANPAPGLWIILEHNLWDVGFGVEYVYAMHAGGYVQPILPGTLQTALQAQNALRAAEGLPPLPDPTTITQQEPAIAGP